MNRLLLGLVLTCAACGPYQVEVTGGATITYDIKLDLIQQYFEAYCQDEYPNNEEAQTQCVNIELAKFLKSIEPK